MESNKCVVCDIICTTKQGYDKHVLTKKHEKNTKKVTVIYECIPCNQYYSTKRGYDQHTLTQKHRDNDTSRKYKCIPCDIQLNTKSNYNRHILSKTHKCKTVEQVKQDPNLIQYVMEQMSKQNETIQALVSKVGNTTIDNSVNSHNKTFNLNIFLNEQCKDAINWTDFIQNIKVSLEDIDVQSNITDKVIGTICKELDTLGLYKRPIHCTDVKRHKSCIKDNNEWKKDPALLEKGIKLVSGKYQKVINDDCLSTPKWFEDQELTEKIMERMNVYMKEPEEKCMAEILKHAVIKEVL